MKFTNKQDKDMMAILIVYVVCTVLIGIGYISRIDDPYSRILTIFGMPVMIWIMLGRLFRRVWFSCKFSEED